MRVCWNRQTGTFEGRVFYDVWVQVPSRAPFKMLSIFIDGILFFFYSYGFVNGKSHKILLRPCQKSSNPLGFDDFDFSQTIDIMGFTAFSNPN